MKRSLLLIALTASLISGSRSQVDELRKGFLDPPAEARPWVYWVWMDGHSTKEGIRADLKSMKRAGIGGVILMEVNVGIPVKPVKFMSPQWRQR